MCEVREEATESFRHETFQREGTASTKGPQALGLEKQGASMSRMERAVAVEEIEAWS